MTAPTTHKPWHPPQIHENDFRVHWHTVRGQKIRSWYMHTWEQHSVFDVPDAVLDYWGIKS